MSAHGLWDALQRKRAGTHKESENREAPAGMVMIGSIENDLKALCQDKDTRKKYPDLKDAAERATLKLRTFHSARGNNADQLSVEVLQSDQVLRPFLLACATKNPQLTVLALSAIQRLFSLDSISARFLSTVLGALRIQTESTNEKVQVRVLQTLLQALSPRAIQTTELLRGCLLQALGICFKLYDNKNPVIRHTAFAALRQVVELLFDHVQEQLQAAGWDSTETSDECNNAVFLFRDLCVLCSQGEKSKPTWLNFPFPLVFPQTAALELLESVLLHSEVLFRSSTLFTTLLRLEMCPMLVAQLSTAREFPIVLRLIRIVRQVILGLHERLDMEAEMFMCLLCKMLSSDKPPWTRILALELLYTLSTEGRIMYFFFARQLRVTSAEKSVQNYFTALAGFLQQTVQDGATQWRIHTGKTKGLQLLSETEPPIYPELYGATLGIECLVQIVSSFAALTRDSNLPENASSYRLDFDKSSHNVALLPPPSTANSAAAAAAAQSSSAAYLALTEATTVSTTSKSTSVTAPKDVMSTPPSAARHSPPPSPLRLEDSPSSSPPPSPSASSPLPPLMLAPTSSLSLAEEADLIGQHDLTHELLLTPEEIKTLGEAEEPARVAAVRRFLIDKTVLGELVTAALQPLLSTLSLLLSKAENEDQIQHLLLAFQSYTHSAGTLGLSRPQDAFLSALCGFAITTTIAREEGASTAIRSLKESYAEDENAIQNRTPLLTSKNIQALKALFNISHSLGGLLGPSWLVVLETFQQLDTIIQICEELRASSDPSVAEWAPKVQVNRTELGLLKGALAGLFEATKYLDDGAVAHLLSALGNLSLTSLANAATSEKGLDDPAERGSLNPKAVRMFALTNLISTFENNMFRVSSAKLWEIAVGHLTCVVNHKNPQIRAYGVNALTRLVLKALGKKQDNNHNNEGANNNNNAEESPRKRPQEAESPVKDDGLSFKPRADPHIFQYLLLEPFTDLYRSKYEDTKYDILEAVYSILQNTGQALQSGWPTILSIFQAVAAAKMQNRSEDALNKEAQAEMSVSSSLSPSPTGGKAVERKAGYIAPASFIPLAFKSVLLISNDFLECIPYSDMNFLIETIGWYGLQGDDTNISFTSIGLLWRVSDHLARFVGVPGPRRHATAPSGKVPKHTSMSIHKDQRLQPLLAQYNVRVDHHGSAEEATGGKDGQEVLSNELADQLMVAVFVQLYTLATDPRSEVRNSACKTLFSTMAAHGERMAATTCLQCMHYLIFPLLFDLMESRETQLSVGASGQALGNDKGTGKKVMMMVHYSRDTPEKQWDETLVYALQGSARTFRLFMKTLSSTPERLQEDWKRFLLAFEIMITGFGTEVCTAAISAVQDVLMAESALVVFSENRDAWHELLPFYQRVVARAIVQLAAPDALLGQPIRRDQELNFFSVETIVASAHTAITTAAAAAAAGPGVDRQSSAVPLSTFLNKANSVSTDAALGSPAPVQLSRFLTSPPPQTVSAFLGDSPEKSKAASSSSPSSPSPSISSVASPPQMDVKEGEAAVSDTPMKAAGPSVPSSTFSAQLSPLLPRLGEKNPRWEHWMKAFTHLLGGLQAILNSCRKLFVDQELADLLDIVYLLTKVADRGEKVNYGKSSIHRETPQQAASLKILGSLAPIPAPLWPVVIRHVTSTVCGDAGVGVNHKMTQLPFTTSFIKQGQRMMVLLYCSQAPVDVCIEHFEMVVCALHELITFTSRGPTKYPDLCMETIQTLIKVAAKGVWALNQAPLSRPNTAGDALRIWSLLADTISSFLAPLSDFPTTHDSEDSLTGWEELQKTLIDALVTDILPQAQTAPQSILWRLINLLASSYVGSHPTPGTELLDRASLSGLFALCQSEPEKCPEPQPTPNSSPSKAPQSDLVIHMSERHSESDTVKRALFEETHGSGSPEKGRKPCSEVSVNIGLIACPLLVARCRVILTSYLADEAVGSMPIHRKEQLRFVLKELGKLVLLRPVSTALGTASVTSLNRPSDRSLPHPHEEEGDEEDEEPRLTLMGQEPEEVQRGGKPIYKPGRRRHLLELFPALCDCVGLRDAEWKPILRDLLHLCAQELQLER